MSSGRTALAWSFSERYASLAINIAGTMCLARLLTPAQVGVFSLCASVVTVAGMLRDFGVSEYLIQEKDLTKEKLQGAFGLAIVIAWSIAALLLLTRDAIAAYYDEPGVADLVGVLSLNFLILPLASPAFALFNREMAFRKIFVVQIISNACQIGTGVALALLGHGYMSLAWASVAGAAAQAVAVTWLRPRDSLFMPRLRNVAGVMKYGSTLMSSRALESVSHNFHEFVIAKQFGFGAVGLFSRAFGLVELFNENVASAIQRVATPSLAADHRAGLPLARTFAWGTSIMTCMAWPVLGFVALMSHDVILVLFGAQWVAAAPIASLLTVSLAPVYLVALGANVLNATGNVRRRVQIILVSAPVHMAGVLVAAHFGLMAVAAVWMVGNLVSTGLYVWHLQRVMHASATELFRPCLRSAAVACACVAAQAGALVVAHGLSMQPLLGLLLVTVVGSIAWLSAAHALRHPAGVEAERLWRQLRPAAAA